MSDLPPPESVTRLRDVDFVGAFSADERLVLVRQFSHCRFVLLGRSAKDAGLALVSWHRDVAPGHAGPAPLFAPPGEAVYVLVPPGSAGSPGSVASPEQGAQTGSGSEASGNRSPRHEEDLVRVDSAEELEQRFPGHFTGIEVHFPLRPRLGKLLRRIFPLVP